MPNHRQTISQRLKDSLDNGRFAFPESVQSTAFTLTGMDNCSRIVVTAAVTVTIPAVGQLKDGFECELINDSGGSVVLDGPGSTNVTLSDGDVACIIEANGKQRVTTGTSTIIS